MPNTLIPIQTFTLSATTASVTFSNIPKNYTDLKVVMSARQSDTNTAAGVQFNGDTGNNYSSRRLGGDATAAYTETSSATDRGKWIIIPFSTATANTFGNAEVYVPNYLSSTAKSFLMDSVSENNSSSKDAANLELDAGLWSGTDAINSVTIVAQTGFVANSTFTLYGISNGVKATGGTFTAAGGYGYHTFTSTGLFIPTQKITDAEILLVAGGGGGGGDAGGGGGAGGVVYAAAQTFNAATPYTALVGSGGAGGNGTSGVKGSASKVSTTSAEGGGWGARGLGDSSTAANGGSGGGGSGRGQASGVNPAGGTATFGQGNNGGSGFGESTTGNQSGGGGGGAGQQGGNSSSLNGGSGGPGTSSYNHWHVATGTGVLASTTYFIAGGGGGGVYSGGNTGPGGIGGGGAAGNGGTAGTANTGGGGGATRSGYSGGQGGSGLVIVRYRLD